MTRVFTPAEQEGLAAAKWGWKVAPHLTSKKGSYQAPAV